VRGFQEIVEAGLQGGGKFRGFHPRDLQQALAELLRTKKMIWAGMEAGGGRSCISNVKT
jgi:hypothetical protein